ncbi:hypothetical protein EDD21DRAFT_420341 [Dissophora ornata]|nr:hypothetical protein BGZ58_001831 [Dissophora ornata]KAI8595741.1 hypothetical protein EDD21DRAFT_420341 [Dissophora ornata]
MPVVVPEECLWLIVSYLHHDRATLHALLLTNTTLFRLAVSYLYASPFRLLHEERNRSWTVVELTKRYDSLVHLLLHSSQLLPDIHYRNNRHGDNDSDNNGGDVVSRLPKYGPEVPALPTPPTIDYLSYYIDMFHDPMLHGTFMTLFPSIPNCYLANPIWYRSLVEIRNRIELAMMDRVLPQVTSLTVNMPIQVPRVKLALMANLRRLEILGTEFCLLNEQDLVWETTTSFSTESRSRNGSYPMSRLDKMLTFIWDHQRLFGTLRELKIENKVVDARRQPQSELMELVEAMGDRLEVLDVQFWPGAVMFLDRFPVAQLRSLLLHTEKQPEARLEESHNMATFFSHCPRLEEFCMYTGDKDILKAWRPMYGLQTVPEGPGLHSLATRDSAPYSEMSKLKSINIAGLAQTVIEITNEATDLFASTLEAVTVRSWFSGKLSTVPLSWTGSTLARLTDLDLEGEVAWTFDFVSLLSCPRLCRIRLAFTGPMPSRSLKKQPAINHLTQIVTLQDLELVGHWETLTIRRWPLVIAKMHYLERLDLVACEGITADQVFNLVRDIVGESAQWRMRESSAGRDHDDTMDRKVAVTEEYLYRHCRLRWVIVSKRLADHILRQWNDWKRWLATSGEQQPTVVVARARLAETGSVSKDTVAKDTVALGRSPFVRASVERVRFSFVTTARPSSWLRG